MQVKDLLSDAHKGLSDLADKLRAALPNANLADVVAAAAGRCKQGSEHADAEHAIQAVHDAAANEQKLERPETAELSGMPVNAPPAIVGSDNGTGGASQQGGG